MLDDDDDVLKELVDKEVSLLVLVGQIENLEDILVGKGLDKLVANQLFRKCVDP